ncbi:hypothetical protein BsWGS_01928 [Bradybaena similaris]
MISLLNVSARHESRGPCWSQTNKVGRSHRSHFKATLVDTQLWASTSAHSVYRNRVRRIGKSKALLHVPRHFRTFAQAYILLLCLRYLPGIIHDRVNSLNHVK